MTGMMHLVGGGWLDRWMGARVEWDLSGRGYRWGTYG